MTIYKCVHCDKEFDDKYYMQNHNELGLTETLLSHAKFHEDVMKIKQNYFKRKEIRNESR